MIGFLREKVVLIIDVLGLDITDERISSVERILRTEDPIDYMDTVMKQEKEKETNGT